MELLEKRRSILTFPSNSFFIWSLAFNHAAMWGSFDLRSKLEGDIIKNNLAIYKTPNHCKDFRVEIVHGLESIVFIVTNKTHPTVSSS